jgi:uncharacterized protein YlxW (UPF0749 family)
MEMNPWIDSHLAGHMTQLSKVLKSRDEWRSKAIRRAEDLREQRKANRRHRGSIAELKSEVESLRQSCDAIAKKNI